MTRREEILLLFVSGFLLTFGIHDHNTDRRRSRNQNSLSEVGSELSCMWAEVGGYLRHAKESHEREQAAGEKAR